MPSKPFTLSIVTPEKTVYEGEVTSVTLPGADGYVGIWANHAPMVSAMRAGALRFDDAADPGRQMLYAVDAGFCEVSDNNVIVLVDGAEEAGMIDTEGVKSHLELLKAQLREHLKDPDFDADAIRAQIEADEAQLKVAYTRGSRE